MSLSRYEAYKSTGIQWVNEVPNHWKIQPLRRLIAAPLANGIFKKKDDFGAGTPLINVFDIYRDDFLVSTETLDRVACTTPEIAAYQVLPGDLFFVRSSLKIEGIAAVAIAQGCDEATVFECHLVRARPNPNKLCPRFASYILNSAYYRSMMVANAKITTMTTIDQEAILSIPLLVPCLSEQHTIAAFLDRETAIIDALIDEQKRLVEVLKEKRQAIVLQAVSRGLEPHVAMKNSNVEWLGEVPRHWDVLSLGRLTLDKCDGPFGSGLKSEHYADEGVRVIRLQNIRIGGFDGSDAVFIDERYYRNSLGDHDVHEGDVLIAGLGDDRNTVGRACVAPAGIEPAMVKADCFRFRLDTARALPDFIATQLTIGAPYDAGMLSSGSTRSRIALFATATRKIACPPLCEQRKIMLRLDQQTLNIDELTNAAETAIALLLERRIALISAAVTGKIDVRGVVAVAKAEAA